MKKSLLLAGLLGASTMMAGDWYTGLGFGKSYIDSGITTTGTATLDEGDTAWKIYGGYKYNQYLSTELSYSDLGDLLTINANNGDSFTIDGATANVAVNNAAIILDAQSIGLSAVLSYPLHKNFEPFIKAGLHRYKINVSAGVSGATLASTSDTGTDFLYGLGFNAPITENISFRTEYEVFSADSYDSVSALTFGVNYKF